MSVKVFSLPERSIVVEELSIEWVAVAMLFMVNQDIAPCRNVHLQENPVESYILHTFIDPHASREDTIGEIESYSQNNGRVIDIHGVNATHPIAVCGFNQGDAFVINTVVIYQASKNQ